MVSAPPPIVNLICYIFINLKASYSYTLAAFAKVVLVETFVEVVRYSVLYAHKYPKSQCTQMYF